MNTGTTHQRTVPFVRVSGSIVPSQSPRHRWHRALPPLIVCDGLDPMTRPIYDDTYHSFDPEPEQRFGQVPPLPLQPALRLLAERFLV
jgi:hypothetical protein